MRRRDHTNYQNHIFFVCYSIPVGDGDDDVDDALSLRRPPVRQLWRTLCATQTRQASQPPVTVEAAQRCLLSYERASYISRRDKCRREAAEEAEDVVWQWQQRHLCRVT